MFTNCKQPTLLQTYGIFKKIMVLVRKIKFVDFMPTNKIVLYETMAIGGIEKALSY